MKRIVNGTKPIQHPPIDGQSPFFQSLFVLNTRFLLFISKICRYDSHRHEEHENDDDINIQKTINTNSGAEDDSSKKKKKKKEKKKSKKQEKGSKKSSKVNTDAEEQSGDVSHEINGDSMEIQVPIEQTVKLGSVELEPTMTVKGLDVTDDENTESMDNSMEVGENKVVEADTKRLISTETTTSTERVLNFLVWF